MTHNQPSPHTPRTARTGRRRLVGALALATAATLSLTACGSSQSTAQASPAVVSRAPSHSPYRGTPLTRSFPKPDLTLTDTGGKPFDLRRRTAGRVVLLYFGYTGCPDACPTTMGDIGVALRTLPAAQRRAVDVVFVSTDPAHDTPAVLRTWLARFDDHAIGLTGDLAKVKKAARSVGITVEDPMVQKDGSVESTHGSQVLAYSPTDDRAHVLYLSGTRSRDYAHDLPLLIRGVRP